jgi:uncharacterized membrane protein YjfL (UPF0719 family)
MHMMQMEWLRPDLLVNSIVFALMGVGMFCLCFAIIDKLTHHDLWAEIVEKRNTALAIVVASVCLSIGLIVAAAIHG